MINRISRFVYQTILITTSLLCTYSVQVRAQQKVQFTQYMFNELILNPAFAGNEGALSATIMDRSQWVSVEGAPVTQTLSAHTFFSQSKLGAGLSFINDKIGVHRTQNINGDVAYHLPFSNTNFLSFGLRAGINIRKSDYASIAGNSIDPMLANPDFSHTSFVIGAGLYYKSQRFQLGISVPDLIPEKVAVSDTASIRWRTAQYYGFVRYQLTLNSSIDIAPAILIKYMNGLPVSYDINASVIIRKALTIGLSYRKKESVSFLLKAKFTPQLQIGYAYDFGIGQVASSSSGSHEAMLNYIFRYTKKNIVSPR
jgi:type IX secretion system PorP/SprF family membrane protein